MRLLIRSKNYFFFQKQLLSENKFTEKLSMVSEPIVLSSIAFLSLPSFSIYFQPRIEHCRNSIQFSVSVPVLSVSKYCTLNSNRLLIRKVWNMLSVCLLVRVLHLGRKCYKLHVPSWLDSRDLNPMRRTSFQETFVVLARFKNASKVIILTNVNRGTLKV